MLLGSKKKSRKKEDCHRGSILPRSITEQKSKKTQRAQRRDREVIIVFAQLTPHYLSTEKAKGLLSNKNCVLYILPFEKIRETKGIK